VCLILKADCYYIIIVIIYRRLLLNTKLTVLQSKGQERDLIDSISSGHTGILPFIEYTITLSKKSRYKGNFTMKSSGLDSKDIIIADPTIISDRLIVLTIISYIKLVLFGIDLETS
jgi:hypothetical protein